MENRKNDLLWLILLHAIKVHDSLKNWGAIDFGSVHADLESIA